MKINIFDTIAAAHFDKENFFDLIDADNRLDNDSRQHYWSEYAVYCKENLITFYKSLDSTNPTPAYIRESMNRFFDAVYSLHSKDLLKDIR